MLLNDEVYGAIFPEGCKATGCPYLVNAPEVNMGNVDRTKMVRDHRAREINLF
jgi:hypothetical protein